MMDVAWLPCLQPSVNLKVLRTVCLVTECSKVVVDPVVFSTEKTMDLCCPLLSLPRWGVDHALPVLSTRERRAATSQARGHAAARDGGGQCGLQCPVPRATSSCLGPKSLEMARITRIEARWLSWLWIQYRVYISIHQYTV